MGIGVAQDVQGHVGAVIISTLEWLCGLAQQLSGC
jgi:hypothetical protein